MMFQCLYIFFGWEKGHQLSTNATGGGIQNVYNCAQGKEVSRLMCTWTLALSLFIFLAAIKRTVSLFTCRNLTLPLFKKDVFVRIFLVKISRENNISIPINPRMICFWIWLFGGAAYEGGEEVDEETLSNKSLLIWCGDTNSTWK